MSSIPLSALPPAADDIRRDQWGRYLIVPPGGGEPIGHTRVTTVAKALDDGGGLAPWKATMNAIGMMLRPGLRYRWQTLISEHDGDPWYAGELEAGRAKIGRGVRPRSGLPGRARDGQVAAHADGVARQPGAPSSTSPTRRSGTSTLRHGVIARGVGHPGASSHRRARTTTPGRHVSTGGER